jgi:hypothetical protein
VLEAHLATCALCSQELLHWREIAGALLQEDRRIPPDRSAAEGWDTLQGLLSAQPPRGGEHRRRLRLGAKTKGDLPMLQGRERAVTAVVALAAVVLLFVVVFHGFGGGRPHPQTAATAGTTSAGTTPTASTASPTPTPTPTSTPPPTPPTAVELLLSAPGIAPTSQSVITLPSGTPVTLMVVPDHSLLPFQTYTMGIYATDPYGFSELQYCTYPNTATCSYLVADSSSENTDYTKGQHTFRAFLGDIGGRILTNSNSITILWA